MKLYHGSTPIKSLNIHNYEMSTNDATMVESDLQAGVVGYARGRKLTGTGKAFEFANYGELTTNMNRFVPNNINVIEITSSYYPVKSTLELKYMKDVDFSTDQNVATVIIDNVEHDLVVSVKSNVLKISCDETVQLQVFYGKDNYV